MPSVDIHTWRSSIGSLLREVRYGVPTRQSKGHKKEYRQLRQEAKGAKPSKGIDVDPPERGYIDYH